MIDRGQAGRRDTRALAYSKMTSADGYKWRECWSCKLSACNRHAEDQYKQKSSVGTKSRKEIVMTSRVLHGLPHRLLISHKIET